MNFNIFSMPRQPRGGSPFGFLFFIIIIILILFIFDIGFIITSQCKDNDDLLDCVLTVATGMLSDEPAGPAPEGSVTASGIISGEFNNENHSVEISITFPLAGGAVTGSFSGDCDGTITGTYAGGEGGAISGTGNGSCGFVVPASGDFSGSVNQAAKTVSVNGSSSALGITKEGSMTLSY